jgi:peptide/nickel transport system substrate-binding protein
VDNSLQAWGWLDWNIFDHPLEVDHDGRLVPGLATGWRWLDDRTLELTLRQGVQFHNGESFDAEIMHLNWHEHIRFEQPNILGKHMSFKSGSRLDIVDAHTVRLVFPEPDGGALHKLAHLHIANRQFYRELGWGEKSW